MRKQVRQGGLLIWLCAVSLVGAGQPIQKVAARVAKVTPDLLAVMQPSTRANARTAGPGPGNEQTDYVIVDGAIAIEGIAVDQQGERLLSQLQTLGLRGGVAYRSMTFGYLPLDKLDDLKDLPALHYARPYYKPVNNTGLVTSQGDKALRADVARSLYGVTGAGSKVGILSDSYNALQGAAAGVASGDLPAGVQVLNDYAPGSDEGRAMAEIIHDVAPGAGIAFNTAYRGMAGFARGIIDLANAGCTILVDDVIYLTEPFFQDGIISQAVDQVVTNNNSSYFSSAGNYARSSYMSEYRNSGINLPGYGLAHDFGGGDIYQKVTIPAGGSIQLAFQWDEPFRSVSGGTGAQTDLDVLVFRGELLVAFGASDNIYSGDPVEVTGTYINRTTEPQEVNIVIVKYAGPDAHVLRWVNFESAFRPSVVEYATQTGAMFGHNSTSRAIAVGAARYSSTPAYDSQLTTAIVEPFSSVGGVPVYFDAAGQRINGMTGVVRQKPDITSVDGGNTTFFSTDTDGDGWPNFLGTSAAAPHAAAVAALMQERAGNRLSPDQVLATLRQTALDMDDPSTPGFDIGFDFSTGFGFIQADKALQALGNNDGLTITGIQTLSCVATTATERLIRYEPIYSGSSGQPIVFQALNETLPTDQPGPYEVRLYTDNPVVRLQAVQGTTTSTYAYRWLDACGAVQIANQPPIFNGLATITGTTATLFRYAVPPTAFTDPEGQPVTIAMSNLPVGLSFDGPTNVISGIPLLAGTTVAILTATDPAGGSTSASVTITISDPAPVPAAQPSLTITSYTCHTLSANRFSVDFVVGYANGSFTPALPPLFMNGVTGNGQLGVQYTYTYDENGYVLPIQDQDTRATYFVWNFRAVCGNAPVANRPPVFNGTTPQSGVISVPFQYVLPAGTFTDPDGQTDLAYTATNLPPGLSFTAQTIEGRPLVSGVYVVRLTARDAGGLTATGTLTITINATVPIPFVITGVRTLSCVATTATERLIRYEPIYSGSSGQSIVFQALNETLPTDQPGPYEVRLYTDNPVVRLQAVQGTTTSTYAYRWLDACAANGRLKAPDEPSELTVVVLSNPVPGETVDVTIQGAAGQILELELTDEQGRSISRMIVQKATASERQTIRIGNRTGVYLLKVSTLVQRAVVRVVKQ